MPARFGYPCPDCRSTNNLHEPGCAFVEVDWQAVEEAHVDVLAPLSVEPMDENALRDHVAAREGASWDALHQRVLATLRETHRVKESDAGNLELVPPEERKERLREPAYEPLSTIYHRGSVPGAHDNAVFALIAFYEMVGFTWPETKRLVIEWLHESGTWARGGFEEDSPEELLESKRHVYEEGYGWKEKARAAKSVIERSL